MTFGEKLSSLRKQANLTQNDLAKKLNVSRQAITKWEGNMAFPDLDSIKKISSIFNIKIDDLLDYKIEEIKLELDTTEEIGKGNINFKNVDNFVLERFSNAKSIERLTREVKLTFWQGVCDFFLGAGTLEVADIIKTGLVFPYLINQDDIDYLVLISKGKLISKKLNKKFVEKSIVVDGYKYSRPKNNKLK